MKITVQNLGIIREPTEFQLRPLTIFIGPNNSGKTWLAYTLAGIFDEYGWNKYTSGEKEEEIAKFYPPIVEAVDQLLATGSARLDLIQFAEEYGEIYFNHIAETAEEWLSQYMATHFVSFNDLKLFIKLDQRDIYIFTRNVLYSRIQARIGINKDEKSLLTLRKKKGGNT